MAAESEHCEGDEGSGPVESVGDPSQQPDLGVGRFDEPLGQLMVEVGVDRIAVSADLLSESDERWELLPPCPGQPFVEGFFAFFSLDSETHIGGLL